MPVSVFILCKSLRFSHSLDCAQNPQQNSELERLIKFQLEVELARNILTDQARAEACSKSLKVVELELEPKSSERKARASSKLELLATLWCKPNFYCLRTFVKVFQVCSGDVDVKLSYVVVARLSGCLVTWLYNIRFSGCQLVHCLWTPLSALPGTQSIPGQCFLQALSLR